MKKYILLFITIISVNSFASQIELRIEDIVNKVSKENFLLIENAEKVYQKKETIKFSRANLLPKLNLWNILKLPAVLIDPLSLGDIIQDVAPFLVPANWFKLGQSKYFYKAQVEQYRALWANEVNIAKLLFMSVYRDQALMKTIEENISNYKEILEIAKVRHIFGRDNLFAYNLIQDRYLALIEDNRNLKNLTYSETKQLQYLTGISNEEDVLLIGPSLPNISNAKEVEFSKIIFKVIDASPEVYQYEHLLNSLSKVRGQIKFSILGTSSYSLGEGSGTFNNIPIQDGLGFGLGSSVNIAKSEGRILKTQLKATIETLKRQVNVLVKEYNSLIANFNLTQERVALAKSNYESMMSYISIGGAIDALEMMEIMDNLYASKVLLLSYKFRFNDLEEKIKRMTFSGDYANGPSLQIGEDDAN